jgi:hypothetical protein
MGWFNGGASGCTVMGPPVGGPEQGQAWVNASVTAVAAATTAAR